MPLQPIPVASLGPPNYPSPLGTADGWGWVRPRRPVEVKYIGPSSILRSRPANCDDSLLCDQLARRAADAAMAGKADLIVGNLNGPLAHVPIPLAVAEKRRVDVEKALWSAVLAVTGQPRRFGD